VAKPSAFISQLLDDLMFGMKRRATEQAAKQAAELKAARQAAHKYLVAELRDTVEWLIASHDLAGRTTMLLTKAEAIRRGIDAVLVNGLEAFGPELKDEDQPVRGGAMVANAKRNMLLLTGAFDRAEARGDFCHILGFSRDGSQVREDASDLGMGTASPSPTGPSDIFASMRENISRAIEGEREKSRAYLARLQNAPTPIGTPAEKISAAREFVRNSKVGMAALRVWHATLHYHAWCKREDWQKWNDIGVTEVVDKCDLSPDSTGFRWGDRTWMFSLEKGGPSYSGDKDLGVFRTFVDGDLVMELAVARGYGEFDEWHETDVNALVVGSWASSLVEMWAELELAQQRRQAETETARREAQASRIKPG
jgi:hypothetical protein